MKGLNVKKLAAIAAGAALVGTAMAPMVTAMSLTKADVYKDTGVPNVDVVVGSMAAVSDVVWAGNIAAKIAENAYTTQDVTTASIGECSSDATANVTLGDVKLTVGGTVSYGAGSKQFKQYLNSATGANEVDANTLTDAQLPHLYNESMTQKINNSTYTGTVQEKIILTVDAKFDTSSAVKDLVARVPAGLWYYEVNLGTSVPMDQSSNGTNYTYFSDSGSQDNVKIPIFGQLYELRTADFNSATKSVKLIKSSAKVRYNEGEVIDGLKGRATLDGQNVTVKVAAIAQTGANTTTYEATLELYDDQGTKVDTQTVTTGSDMSEYFVNSNGDYVLSSTLTIEGIYLNTTSQTAYIEITKGTDSMTLYDGKGYPYDPTNTTGIYDYKIALGAATTGSYFSYIRVLNSRDAWDSGSTEGLLYPTDETQSLTGHAAKTAIFGNSLADGTLGKGFATIEWAGFEDNQTRTPITVGRNIGNLDPNAWNGGGAKFRGADDTEHHIPFALKLNRSGAEWDTAGGNTFLFDTKTIWYGVETTTADTNTMVCDGNYVNGRKWTIVGQPTLSTTDHNMKVTVEGMGQQFGWPNGSLNYQNVAGVVDMNVHVGNVINYGINLAAAVSTGDDLNFHITGDDNKHNCVWIKTDGWVQFRKSNNSGTILTPNTTVTATNSPTTYNKWFFQNSKVYDANAVTAAATGGNVALIGASDKTFEYAFYAGPSGGTYFWLMLDDQNFTVDESYKIQNSHQLNYLGTTPPTSAGAEGAIGNYDYKFFFPNTTDFNGSGVGGNSYFISGFQAVDYTNTKVADYNLFINNATSGMAGPFPNSNMGNFSSDVAFLGPNSFNLQSGTTSTYVQKGWSDTGSKSWLDTTNDNINLSFPQAKLYSLIYVLGTDVVRETTGEQITVALGETGATTGGTKVTVDEVPYDATCAGGTGVSGGMVCTATPSQTMVKAMVPSLVKLDTSAGAGYHVIVGGPAVNTLAAEVSGLRERLTASGDYVAEVMDGDIVVAGYTASDTGRAAQELIDALSLME